MDSTVVTSSGAAALEVPIELPPGPGGLQPALALAYSSLAGDDFLGVGWTLPLGEIRCTSRFGVPRDFSACPQFEYDGELLLGPDDAGHYHTFVESFQRIRVVDAGPDGFGFEVTEPDGTRFFYGTAEDARIRHGDGAAAPIAVWRLSEVRDGFGNAVTFEYERSDRGVAYPARIAYGDREVLFLYEPRPDPLHDFPGGLERRATQRLRELQVTAGGLVHQRLLLDYSEAGDYTTHRSRLVSVQRFGADCPPAPQPLSGCSALPAQRFSYTDPADERFATPDGSQWLLDPGWPHVPESTPYSKLADVDGDGLLDWIVAHCAAAEGDWPCAGPGRGDRRVHLNTGAGIDPTPDPAWSAALEALLWDAPVLHVVQPLGLGHTGAAVCSAVADSYPSGVFFDRRDEDVLALDVNALAVVPDPVSGQQRQTIGVEAHWRVLDVDGDGRADLVASSRVGGVWKKLADDCSQSAAPDGYVESVSRVVFLNDGAGWVRAPSLEAGLPTLAAMEISDTFGSEKGDSWYDPCAWYGWWGRDAANDFPATICRQMVEYPVSFVELDGDGRLDILAQLPMDRRFLPFYETSGCGGYDMCVHNPDRTLAFVQRRDAAGEWVFERDARFDLRDPLTGEPLHHRHLVQSGIDLHGTHEIDGTSFFSMSDGFGFADLNADGLTDVVWRDPFAASGHPHPKGPSLPAGVLLNTGAGWCPAVAGSPCEDALGLLPEVEMRSEPVAGIEWVYDTSELPELRDTNGDRLPDFYHRIGDSRPLQLFSPGDGVSGTVWREDASGRFDGGDDARFDHDGDGAVDRWLWDSGGSPGLGRSQSRLPDLLRRVDNGRGGVVEFGYTTGSAQRDPGLEAEAAAHAAAVEPGGAGAIRFSGLPVVESVRVTGPNREPATTLYAWARPGWCAAHRAGLGYRLMRETRSDGSVLDRFFHQAHGRAGRLSEQVLRDGGRVLHRVSEVWELADPAEVTGAWAGDGSAAPGPGEPVRIGRLASRTRAYEYGAEPGEVTGAVQQERRFYDDVHGFNFVSRIETTRPTSETLTLRTPSAHDPVRWIAGLPERERFGSPQRGLLMSDVERHYTPEGRVETTTRLNARRDGGSAGDPVVTRLEYDARGNVARRVDGNGQVTELCYDGNPAGHAWCDAPPGDGGALVALRDPLGAVATFETDPVFGGPRIVRSPYRDVPGTRVERDAFGRELRTYALLATGGEVQVSETRHDDEAVPPIVQRFAFADAAGADAVRTATVGDGFGGVWKQVEEVPPDASGTPRHRGVATWHDPQARTRRTTLPIACADALCSGLGGRDEAPATLTTLDAAARPLRVDAPSGSSVRRYASTAIDPVVQRPGVVEEASPPTLDAVLEKNPKGDLLRRTWDGDRVVSVDECRNAPDASLAALDAVACLAPDRTLYGYQGDGALEVVYDAVAVAGARWEDPRHALHYGLDTLARTVEIRDPDAGLSQRAYDAEGNLLATTDARGQTRVYAYDAGGRLTGIDTPPGEADVAISHRSGEWQPGSEAAGPDGRVWWYDALGRVKAERIDAPGASLRAFYRHDLRGRRTRVRHLGAGGALHFEYTGDFLERICRGAPCSDPDAEPYVDGVTYDALGRRVTMALPAGIRSFEYTEGADPAQDPRNLTRQSFVGSGATADALTHAYDAYDELGNVLAWSVQGTLAGMDATVTHAYDQRNRLVARSVDGEQQLFAYDALGNMVIHGGDVQEYAHPGKPHALTARAGASYAHDAAGNVASITAANGAGRHFDFDSAGRLVCIGTAPAGCDVLRIFYDARGNRLREVAGGTTRRFLGDDLMAVDGPGGGTTYHVQIRAFGERIATSIVSRAAAAWSDAIPIGGREVSPGWLAPVPLLAALWLIGLGIRAGLLTGVARRPATAALSALLIASVAVPAPASAGGAIEQVEHRWVITDRIGSGVALIDGEGAIVRQTRFRPYGAVEAEAGPGAGGSPRRFFAGHPEQGESALIQMQARWMDPASGTLLAPDPFVSDAADPGTHNAYAYARNNPASFVDPDGRAVACVGRCLVAQGRHLGGAWLFSGHRPPDANGIVWPLAGPVHGIGGGPLRGGKPVGPSPAEVGTSTDAASGETSGGNPIMDLVTAVADAVVSLARILLIDVALAIAGIAGTAFGLGLGALSIAVGIITLSVPAIGFGVHHMGWALVPRYGFWSGPGWGLPNQRLLGGWFGPFGNLSVIESATYLHDHQAGRPGADRRLIRNVWSRHDLGPYAQVYRLGLTFLFGTRVALGFDG